MAWSFMFGRARQWIGALYIFINVLLLLFVGVLAFFSIVTGQGMLAIGIIFLPVLGIFAGKWIKNGRFGFWRVLGILFSLGFAFVAVYLILVLTPAIKKHRQSPPSQTYDTKESLSHHLKDTGGDLK